MKSFGSTESDSGGLMMGGWGGCISVAFMLIVGVGGILFVAWSLRASIQSAGEDAFDVISWDGGVVDSRSVTPFDGRGWLVVRVRGRMRRVRRVVRGVCIFAVVGSGFAAVGCVGFGLGGRGVGDALKSGGKGRIGAEEGWLLKEEK